eukprot:1348-Heterococcus_DN1.PRE.1
MFAMKIITLFAVVLASVAAFSPASTLLGSSLKHTSDSESSSSSCIVYVAACGSWEGAEAGAAVV